MAYGVPLPQVPLPYFYPTKISTTAVQPSTQAHLPTDIKLMPENFLSHLKTPLNFSKNGGHITENIRYHQSVSRQSSTPPTENGGIRSKSNSLENGNIELIEESENVEID